MKLKWKHILAAVVLTATGCSRQSDRPTSAVRPVQPPTEFPLTNILIVEEPRSVAETVLVEIAPADPQEMERKRIQRMTLLDDRKREKGDRDR